jgi:GAF domain-containing protein/HAMP domain-containing protein
VPGAAGTWKDLTGNVNLLADNLTNQVRAIAEVATAVTKGDLTRSIQVEARGEVAELKDNINTMIDNLRLTTDRNTEQDWLKTNLARFTNMLQGQRDLTTVGRLLLSELTPLVSAHQGVIYRYDSEDLPCLKLLAAYADDRQAGHPRVLSIGQGLVGQCAAERQRVLVNDVPADVVPVATALFKAPPRSIVVLPVLFEGQVKAVIELASLTSFTGSQLTFLDQLTASIGIVLNSIEATMQTEGLLGARRSRLRPPRRSAAAHRRRRPSLRQSAGRHRARHRLQGARRRARLGGARAGAPVPADGGVARRVPARHARPVLSHLKHDPATRHIPVQMLTLDEDRQHGLARGAFAFLTKPATPDALAASLERMRAMCRRGGGGCWWWKTIATSR